MNCKDLKELLSAYADGELSRTQREFVEEHLAVCADCKATLDGYRVVNQKLSSLREAPAMPDRKGAIMSKIKDTSNRAVWHWLRPALGATAAIIILAVLLVTQPWGLNPQSVMARAHAATEGLQSYRMSYRSITQDIRGETSELTTESEFVAPESYHVRLTADDDVTEFIIVGGKQYARDSDQSKATTFAVARSSSSFLTKEVTLKMLDGLTDLQKLPDEKIDGTDCLHYRGRVDMEKQIEEAKANLDPSNPHDARLLKEVEQLRNWKTEVDLWIGKHDYLIRQMKHDWQVPVEDTEQWETSSVAVKYYDFNEQITITPPLDADGKLLPGWNLVASYPARRAVFLSGSATSTIVGEDFAHQQISYRITITNVGEEVASNVRVTVHTRATNDKRGSITLEAQPSAPGPINLGPAESETYNVSWEYDASHTSKEDLSRLVDYSRVFTKYVTPEGIEDVQVFSTGVVYPLKSPPTQELAAQYEQARQQVDFPINVPTSLPKNLKLSHIQVQGMLGGRQMLILLYGDPRAEHIKLSQRRFDIEMAENGGERQKSFEEAGFSRFTIMDISGYWKQGVLCQTDIDDPSTQYWDMSKIQMFWDEGNMTYQLTARDVSVEELMLFAASMVKID